MLGHQLVIVSDAHIGRHHTAIEERFLAFLESVPDLGDSLLINGDLFDFWFSWTRVIPRTGFHVAAALASLRKRVPIVMIGGNHDRWGGTFWKEDLDIDFHPMETTVQVGDRRVLAIHGDGITESHWSAKLMHLITRHRATIAVYEALHPNIGLWIADRLGHELGNTEREQQILDRAAIRQRAWAEAELQRRPDVGLVVMGHTHRPAVAEFAPGRSYLNPGAWMDGGCYAIVTATDAALRQFPI
ncbi:MAG: UDP-2,3-diacylglucosamine diphosphatase [Gemmatimonadota bacterium]